MGINCLYLLLANVDSSLKFYVLPGFNHGYGPFNATYDALGALMNWVERCRKPKRLVMIDANEDTSGRTRPLCEYPAWPKYIGGDVNDESSFMCVTE